MPSVAMLSSRQAASRPRPPLPRAASGSTLSTASARRPARPSPRARSREAEIAQGVGEQAADQEFEAEIVDPLAVGVVDGAGRGHPAVDEPVAHGERQGEEPVVAGGVLRVLADLVDQLAEDGPAEAFRVEAQRGKADGMLGHHVPHRSAAGAQPCSGQTTRRGAGSQDPGRARFAAPA